VRQNYECSNHTQGTKILRRVPKSYAWCINHTHDVKIILVRVVWPLVRTQSGIIWQSYVNFSWFVLKTHASCWNLCLSKLQCVWKLHSAYRNHPRVYRKHTYTCQNHTLRVEITLVCFEIIVVSVVIIVVSVVITFVHVKIILRVKTTLCVYESH
jgi:hypothetical protein